MKSYTCLIIISSLILSSCGSISIIEPQNERFPSALSVNEKNCSELVKAFFVDTKNEFSVDAKFFQKKTSLEVTNEELLELNSLFTPREFTENADMFRSIFLYSRDDTKTRGSLLNEFKSQINGNAVDEENSSWKKFSHHKNKVDEKKKKIAGKRKEQIYEALYFSCKTQIKGTPTAQDLSRAKRLTYALTAGSLGSSTITYSAVHWEEDKDSKWFNELYFSLGITTVFSFLGGKLVLANPSLNPWTGKMPITFLTNALTDAAVTGVYAALFKT
ncbi:MAG: hypothetical protein K2Q18_19440, partial [Bdellovibrionales bacterium]|nr:hypothetical protein [Bdellovibrionales bacterium]